MGYYMSQRDSNFKIPSKKVDAAFKAIKGLIGKETIHDASGGHFSWVDPVAFKNAKSLEAVFKCWRWEIEIDEESGDVINIVFLGEKLGDDTFLFVAVAPFVAKGSYIEMSGEDGAIWRWTFNGKIMKEKDAVVSWD